MPFQDLSDQEPLISTRIPVNGVQIGAVLHKRLSRQQRPLILLHGFTGKAVDWGNLLYTLTTPNMWVVALDMLGHGQSSIPTDPERYSIENCQADLIGLMQELEVGPGEATLLGYSMGGRIALYSAFSHYFRALILESASPGLSNPQEREQRRLSDQALATLLRTDGVKDFVDYWENIPLFASQSNLPFEKKFAQRAGRLDNHGRGLAYSLEGLGTGSQPSLHARLPALQLPVLLIAGALDTKFSTIAQDMATQLPQAQLQIVPAAGHNIHLEQPEIFTQHVQTFCQNML